jgi:hypothetical protein
LNVKSNFAKNYKKAQQKYPEKFDFHPKTYLIPGKKNK